MPKGLIAAFDVGTTATKGALIDREGRIVREGSRAYGTAYLPGARVEQEPDDWWGAVRELSRAFWRAGARPDGVDAIALTGQMQDVILLDAGRRALGPAILYSDARAGDQATALRAALRAHGAPDDDMAFLDGTAPLAKLVWLRERDPARLARCAAVLYNAKDYILARLTGAHATGAHATDATTAATTGLYSLRARGWEEEWRAILNIPAHWTPPILPADAVAGAVSEDGARATGFLAGTPVYGGMGDAAAATLAAGLTAPGEAYLYLGTTGWAAALSQAAGPSAEGVRYLPYVTGNDVIRIAPLLNVGGVHQWIVRLLGLKNGAGTAHATLDYARFEQLLDATPARSGDAIFLPYLSGERCPVREPRAMGTFVRLGADTGRGAVGWAVMEGVCFSLRLVLDALGASTPTIRVLGGMTRGSLVRQLIADVCGVGVRAPILPEAAGALAAAVPAAVALGLFPDIPACVEAWFGAGAAGDTPDAVPMPTRAAGYEERYRVFKQIYPLVAQLD